MKPFDWRRQYERQFGPLPTADDFRPAEQATEDAQSRKPARSASRAGTEEQTAGPVEIRRDLTEPAEHFEDPAPPPAVVASPVDGMTLEDLDRLRDLVARGTRMTGIAAIMRKPYATIAVAMDQLGLSRAA